MKRRYYGYTIMIIAWALYMCSVPLPSYGAGVITANAIKQFGWSEAVSGNASSMYYISVTAASVVASWLIKKRGIRFTTVVGAIFGMATYLSLAFNETNPVLYVLIFLGTGVCASFCGIITGTVMMNTWFHRRKEFPMSVLMSAGSVGGFVYPVILQKMATVSIRSCWIMFTLLCAASLILALVFVREKPEQIGEIRDGKRWCEMHPETVDAFEKIETVAEPSLKTCYRSSQFWKLSFWLFCSRSLNAGIGSYLIIYALQKNIPDMKAVCLITFYSVSSFAGRMAINAVKKFNISKRAVNTIDLAVMCIGTVMLFTADNYLSFAVAAMICGLGFGFQCTVFSLTVPMFFGDGNFVTMYGMFNALGTVGSFITPLAVYRISVLFNGYGYSYLAIGLLLVVSVLLIASTPVRMINDR